MGGGVLDGLGVDFCSSVEMHVFFISEECKGEVRIGTSCAQVIRINVVSSLTA